MVETSPLTVAVDRFADRLRAAPESRLRRGAAAEALALARMFARWAQRIEDPGGQPREMPEVGVFAVADQITVAGRDLAVVLTDPADVTRAAALVEEARKRAGL